VGEWPIRAQTQARKGLLKITTFEGLIPFLGTRKLAIHTRLQHSKRNMTASLASVRTDERFTELFELACKEPDQDKVGALFEEILCLLESQTTQLDRTTFDVKPHPHDSISLNLTRE
jgi:hypothetical protein